jgi:hypothetical protein
VDLEQPGQPQAQRLRSRNNRSIKSQGVNGYHQKHCPQGVCYQGFATMLLNAALKLLALL